MKRIFLLEDTEIVAVAMKMMISSLLTPTTKVVHAYNIADAVDLLSEAGSAPEEFDLAILDYNLPDGLGTELIQTFRTSAGNCKVCVCSAHVGKNEVVTREISMQGPDAMLGKPMALSDFEKMLRETGICA